MATTRVDQMLHFLRNHPVAAGVTVVGIVVVAIGQFAGAVATTVNFVTGLTVNERAAAESEYCQLLRPLIAELNRSKDAFDRWNERNLPLEHVVIRDANISARDLLRTNARFVSSDRAEAARLLIQHYDRWLVEYERIRGGPNPDTTTAFVFVGPEGYPFPVEAAEVFRQRAAEIEQRYGANLCI